ASARASDEHRRAGLLDRAPQTLAQRNLGRPSEKLLRECDIGPSLFGVGDGQGLVDDLRTGFGQLFDRLRELEQRELVGIANVDGIVVRRLRERDEPPDEVADVAERSRLAAVAEDRERSVAERLAKERGNRAPV